MHRQLFRTLQLGAAACFIGHGAFGVLTKKEWCVFFDIVGIGPETAFRLMPAIGTLDISLGILVLLRPTAAAVLFMMGWTTWTAMCRPLAGLGIWEFFERAGNYGVCIGLLLVSGWQPSRRTLLARLSPDNAPPHRMLETALRIATCLLLVGHGGFSLVMHKQILVTHFAAAGISLPPAAQSLFGATEILLGLGALWVRAPLYFWFLVCWKLACELLYPLAGAPLWEFVERGGSYACPLALGLLLPARIQLRATSE